MPIDPDELIDCVKHMDAGRRISLVRNLLVNEDIHLLITEIVFNFPLSGLPSHKSRVMKIEKVMQDTTGELR